MPVIVAGIRGLLERCLWFHEDQQNLGPSGLKNVSFLRFRNEVSTTNSSLRSDLQHTQVFLRFSPDIELHAARLKQVELLADEVATKPTGSPATKKAKKGSHKKSLVCTRWHRPESGETR